MSETTAPVLDSPPAATAEGPPTAAGIRESLLDAYPKKTRRKREKQIVVNTRQPSEDGAVLVPEIAANSRTVPGIITQRGCCYAGCKGVILGPTRDIVNITHGPIGCGFYSWLTRRNQTHAPTDEHDNFMTYCFSTDMTEENIIFGGEKRLTQAIQEAYDLFHPKAIAVFSTCPVGLIGDDVHQVAAAMKEKLGINVFGFSCEGYRGVSQSAGHHIANNQVFKHVVGEDDTPRGKWSINLLGEYNIGGDAFVIEDLLRRCGMDLVATFSGNSTYDQFANAHMARLNTVMCHRSINYVADMIEKKYGTPWIKVNFIGAKATAKSLRKIAEFFGDRQLIENVERVIGEEYPAVTAALKKYKPRCEGKRAILFVGGSRAHHYQELFAELGMETIAAGYEFAHRDDYEGRRVLPHNRHAPVLVRQDGRAVGRSRHAGQLERNVAGRGYPAEIRGHGDSGEELPETDEPGTAGPQTGSTRSRGRRRRHVPDAPVDQERAGRSAHRQYLWQVHLPRRGDSLRAARLPDPGPHRPPVLPDRRLPRCHPLAGKNPRRLPGPPGRTVPRGDV